MIRRVLFSLATFFALSLPAMAGNSLTEMAQLEVLPGWERADGTRVVGLHIKLAPGWKTYWRAPGDAGIPPEISLEGSRNLQTVSPEWPIPQVFSNNGMRSVGYHDEVVVPVILTPQQKGAPISLSGQLQIGICKDICMPAAFEFDTPLPTGSGTTDPRLRAALADQPRSGSEAGLGRIECRVSVTPDGLSLDAEFVLPETGGDEFAVVETADPEVWVAEADTRREGNTLHVRTEMMHMEGGAFALDRSGIRITVLGSRDAVDIQGCPGP
ncbi:MAG: protein-disulfide reductase DsbD family protein [Thalassovita sp.]|nr:protein-disulfide reductase DsbD family protein [Thalassovita sp.]